MNRALNWIVRIFLIVLGAFVGLIGMIAWSYENVKGGGGEVDGYRIGYLPDGTAEVRLVSAAEFPGAYEIETDEAGDTVVRRIDAHEELGVIIVDGTDVAEVRAWLEEQGPVVFSGTHAEVDAWFEQQRAEGRNYTPAGLIVAAGAVLVITGVIPWRWRHRTRAGTTGPTAPAATAAP